MLRQQKSTEAAGKIYKFYKKIYSFFVFYAILKLHI